MPNSIPIFYLNIPTREDRRKFMEKQLEQLGLTAQRVRGVEPPALTERDRNLYCDTRNPHHLSEQQLCCSMTHIKAWVQFLETDAARVVIFEDDAVLSARLPAFLDQLPEMSADVIRLESSLRPHLTSDFIETNVAGVGMREFRSTGWGSAGYVISRRGAERVLNSPHRFNNPLDWTLFCPLEAPARNLNLLQTDPALCIQYGYLHPEEDQSIGVSDNTPHLRSGSVVAFMTKLKRDIRWGAVKSLDKLTRPHLKRRLIEYSQN